VTLIVTTAGMVSTTWVQFIKGTMLVLLCAFITVLLLMRGITTRPTDASGKEVRILARGVPAPEVTGAAGATVLPEDGAGQASPTCA